MLSGSSEWPVAPLSIHCVLPLSVSGMFTPQATCWATYQYPFRQALSQHYRQSRSSHLPVVVPLGVVFAEPSFFCVALNVALLACVRRGIAQYTSFLRFVILPVTRRLRFLAVSRQIPDFACSYAIRRSSPPFRLLVRATRPPVVATVVVPSCRTCGAIPCLQYSPIILRSEFHEESSGERNHRSHQGVVLRQSP